MTFLLHRMLQKRLALRRFTVVTVSVIVLIYLLHENEMLPSVQEEEGLKEEPIRRLPQCLIIGARKAGTRALLVFLSAHPDIVTATHEIHYFDKEENYKLGTEWYRQQMPPSFPGQISIEKSPAYFHEENVAQRVKLVNQSIKLLLIVTDPVKRAISDYYQLHLLELQKNDKPKSFEERALANNGSVNENYEVLQRSVYVSHIQRWLKYFTRDQLHVVNGEVLVKNPFKEMQKVERFLGLQSYFKESNFYFNQSKGFYCLKQNSDTCICLGDEKGRQHPDIDFNVIQTLHQHFARYNEMFYETVGEDFGWNHL